MARHLDGVDLAHRQERHQIRAKAITGGEQRLSG
jgi:hypothetical protein